MSSNLEFPNWTSETTTTQRNSDLYDRLLLVEEQRLTVASVAEDARRETRSLAAELIEFKEQVREMAITVAEEQGWCTSGLNACLQELGLKPKITSVKAEFNVHGIAYIDLPDDLDPDDEWAVAEFIGEFLQIGQTDPNEGGIYIEQDGGVRVERINPHKD